MRNAIFFTVIYFFSLFIQAQEKAILKGKISDKETGENLPEVDISISSDNSGAVSDKNGNYRIELHPDTYHVSFEYLGYEPVTKVVDLKNNETLDIALEPSTQKLSEIIISNNSTIESLSSPQMSVVSIEPSAIKKVPLVLGEADIVKSLLLLPGISSGGELSTGFNVRGGGTDQNLILLDNATLYNSSHLFGFFSVFNPDAQKSIKLYKGGIPSRFGGRASSVLDIQQRLGDREKFKFGGSIGAISAKAIAEGPIKSNKSSFLIAGRSSYAHLFLKLADNDNSAYFYDLNGKLDYELNSKNKLYFSGYFGRDVFNINDKFKTSYGNTAANFRWEHEFQEDFYSNFYVIFSDFQNQIALEPLDFKYDSSIKSLSFIYDLDQQISDKLTLNYGMNSKYYYLNPGHLQPTDDQSAISEHQFTKKYAWQNAIYVEAKQSFSENISFRYGLRLNSFSRLGQKKINVYENDQPVIYDRNLGIYQEAPVIDSYQKSRKKALKTFNNLEPRASLSYRFLDNNAVKFSYQRLHQYLQMLVNSNSPTPYNLWTPSGEFLNPLRADQYAIGYFRDFKNENVRFEAEMYFKDFKNSIDYISGADLITNDAVETIILNGEARAYGLEFLLKKSMGKLTGWIAYTLSKSEQKTPGRTAEEPGINNGDWYNSPWDKTHDFSVTANYEFNKKWQFNAVFVYQTGQPVTFPVSQYSYEDQNIPNYGRRNSNRLFDFHHLDISAILTPNPSSKKPERGQWVFSIYNLYNRKNAASLNFAENEKTGINEAKRLSVFGIIPSVSYQFNF